MFPFTYDDWRCAIIHSPFEQIIRQGNFDGMRVTLLPEEGCYRFLADPFGIWHNDRLYVFAEAYDYRTAKGVIDVFVYDAAFHLVERQRVLEESWHLSYPYVFFHDGAFYMLPEGYKSGRLNLYRALDFPFQWERVKRFDFPIGAIDATPFHHAGRWWLFWTPPHPKPMRTSALHLSVSEDLEGAWTDMGCILVDKSGARPGGTPAVIDDTVLLPVQDCKKTYGGGIRFLRFTSLGHGKPRLTPSPAMEAPPSLRNYYSDGMHTLAAAGDVTLVDVKKIRRGINQKFFALKRKLPFTENLS